MVEPPVAARSLAQIETSAGPLRATNYIFACGSWLPKLFPDLPGRADFKDGNIFYGMPDLESCGFKVAHDRHGPPIDPDRDDRVASPGALADARVCQYESGSLIDRHPTAGNV